MTTTVGPEPAAGPRCARRHGRGPVGLAALAAAVLAAALAGCATGDPADPDGQAPAPASDSVVNDRLFACLSAEGFAVTRGPDGEINFTDPEDGQFTEYQAAHDRCRQQLVAEGLLPAVDDELLRREYQQLAALQECLGDNGFETLPFPSEDVYVESRDEYGNLFALNTEQEWDRARTSCPEQMAAIERGPAG